MKRKIILGFVMSGFSSIGFAQENAKQAPVEPQVHATIAIQQDNTEEERKKKEKQEMMMKENNQAMTKQDALQIERTRVIEEKRNAVKNNPDLTEAEREKYLLQLEKAQKALSNAATDASDAEIKTINVKEEKAKAAPKKTVSKKK